MAVLSLAAELSTTWIHLRKIAMASLRIGMTIAWMMSKKKFILGIYLKEIRVFLFIRSVRRESND